MSTSTRRVVLGAIFSGPLTGGAVMALPSGLPQLTAPTVCPELARLVQESERAERALDDWNEREERDEHFVGSMEEWKAIVRDAGQARAAVALCPAKTMDELALKARAVVANTESDYETAHLLEDVTKQGGHAYSADLLRGLAIDLLRIAEGASCA